MKCRTFCGGLLSQFSILALLTTTIILLFSGWQRIQAETTTLTDTLHRSLKANTERLATAIERPIYNFDCATVTALCESLLSDRDIIQITIEANKQTLVFPAKKNKIITEPSAKTLTSTKEIKHFNKTIGTVLVRADTLFLEAQIKESRQRIFTNILLLDLFLVFTIVFFLSHKFIRPIRALQKAAKNIANGDLNQEISIQSNNELGQLAESLESMRSELQRKISELSRTKSYLDNIINSMPSKLIGVDGNLQVTLWNIQAESIRSHSPDVPEDMSLSNVFPSLVAEQEKISKAIATKQIIVENAQVTGSGKSITYEDITIYPLISNGVEGVAIRIDDITRQHQMQEELAHSRKLDAIGQLTGGIAHDFNNMLGGILGSAELLGMTLEDNNTKGKRYLDVIIQSGRRAADLNRKLLSFARKDKIESTQVDIAKVLEDAVAILIHSLDKQVYISIDVEAKNTTVIGDPSQLQNAFINLGINAGHAMPEGGELLFSVRETQLDHVYCSTSRFSIEPGEYLEIEVRDTGTGISLEDQYQIFDPFFTTKEEGKGTGLGLAAVHGTVEQHQGAITLYSEPGKGCSFHIYLPRSSQNSTTEHERENNPVTGSGTILLIDDEPVILTSARDILQFLGYTVLVAEDGQKGLEIFSQQADEIDLVLTDMIMPKMNGKNCFLAMQKIDPNVRVLLSSGFTCNTDIEALTKVGLKGFIRKPYTIASLSQVVAKALH